MEDLRLFLGNTGFYKEGSMHINTYLILLDCIHEELVFSSWCLFSLFTLCMSKVSQGIIKKYHSPMVSAVIFLYISLRLNVLFTDCPLNVCIFVLIS